MRLLKLVQIRNLLDESIALEELRLATDILLQRIDSVTDEAEFAPGLKNVRNYYSSILNILDTQPKEFTVLRNQITDRINDITKDWHTRGYMLNGFYASSSANPLIEREDRVMYVSTQTKNVIKNRIAMHASWQYPGLEIGPGDGEWTASLVASDPLYLLDVDQEFLDSTKKQFTDEYQRRLRGYLATDDQSNMLALPHNQIGFAFAWNVFNFFPQTETKNYLTQLFTVLRPGGVLMFSYNNCDNPTQADHAENGWMSWMPRTLLETLLKEIGYEVIQFHEPEVNVSWVEVKKPGTISTIKAHQVLGEIKYRNS